MYDFSGIFYRLWGVCGILLLLGSGCILLEKPWVHGFSFRDCKVGVGIVALAICLSLVYSSRILFPNVSSQTGTFLYYQRNSRVAPPLPVTYEYVFENDQEKKHSFYLDVFSKNRIFTSEFESGKVYMICFDKLTNIIVKAQLVEETPIVD